MIEKKFSVSLYSDTAKDDGVTEDSDELLCYGEGAKSVLFGTSGGFGLQPCTSTLYECKSL